MKYIYYNIIKFHNFACNIKICHLMQRQLAPKTRALNDTQYTPLK